jgi:predicted nucleotidyltransferase
MKNMDELKAYIIASLPEAKIYLFGSRARGEASAFSDIDIAIESTYPIDDRLSSLRDTIENSNIPWKVDLVDLAKAPYLKKVISHEGIPWH